MILARHADVSSVRVLEPYFVPHMGPQRLFRFHIVVLPQQSQYTLLVLLTAHNYHRALSIYQHSRHKAFRAASRILVQRR